MTEPRRSRNHYVSKIVLREFAKGRVVQMVDLESEGRSFPRSIDDAAAEHDYNSIKLADGSLSDVAEIAIDEEIEAPAGHAMARISSGGWFRPEEFRHVARFVLFQQLRSPKRRDEADGLVNLLFKLDAVAEGPTSLLPGLRSELGREPTAQELSGAWESFNEKSTWTFSHQTERHIDLSFRKLEEIWETFAESFSWNVVRWQRRHLLVSDEPVQLVRDPRAGNLPMNGVLNVGSIYFPISRSCCLMLHSRSDPKWDVPNGQELPGSTNGARKINRMPAQNARRWLYHHPDDSMADLLGPGVELPKPPARSYMSEHVHLVSDLLKATDHQVGDWPEEPAQ
jgi:hypothetical protein